MANQADTLNSGFASGPPIRIEPYFKSSIEAENNEGVHRYCIDPTSLLRNDVLRILKNNLRLLIEDNSQATLRMMIINER